MSLSGLTPDSKKALCASAFLPEGQVSDLSAFTKPIFNLFY
jgi:hypothetical protein